MGNLGVGIEKLDFLDLYGQAAYQAGFRTDWIDLASDQQTMYYTTEGTSIMGVQREHAHVAHEFRQ